MGNFYAKLKVTAAKAREKYTISSLLIILLHIWVAVASTTKSMFSVWRPSAYRFDFICPCRPRTSLAFLSATVGTLPAYNTACSTGR
jgi:hypothetical protein